MLLFIGFVLGTWFGIFIMALMAIADRADRGQR